jgi:hypothetical protein
MESSTSTPEDDAIRAALADAVEAYGARVREHGDLHPFPAGRDPSPTDVAVTAAAILRAAQVHSFELAAMFGV